MKNASTNVEADTEPELDLTRLKRITRPGKGTERVTLRIVREGMGKTQLEVAEAMGADQGEVSRIERREDALVSTLRKYAAALGATCEVAFVFPGGRRGLIALAGPSTPRTKPWSEIPRKNSGGGVARGALRGEIFGPTKKPRTDWDPASRKARGESKRRPRGKKPGYSGKL